MSGSVSAARPRTILLAAADGSAMRRSLVVVAVLALLVGPATGVAAADTRSGGTVIVEEGETVDGLTANAGTVEIRGTVEGDLQAYAGTVVITPTGNVTGRFRAYAGSVRIAGGVGQNAFVSTGSLTVTETASIGRSLGATAGSVTIDGTVRGDATVGAGAITLGETATIGGDLTYNGDLSGAPAASVVDGQVRQSSDLGLTPTIAGPLGIALGVYFLLADLLFGGLLLRLLPRYLATAADTIATKPVHAGLYGVATLVGVPLAAALVALTVVGIPLSLAALLAFWLALWVASILGRLGVGTWLLSYTKYADSRLALVVGVVVVAIVARIPFVGGLFRWAVTVLGLGVLALGLLALRDLAREHSLTRTGL
jgi:cytoskeletal protein CcmA (bactofilin family)